jgi:hypothetical protein
MAAPVNVGNVFICSDNDPQTIKGPITIEKVLCTAASQTIKVGTTTLFSSPEAGFYEVCIRAPTDIIVDSTDGQTITLYTR